MREIVRELEEEKNMNLSRKRSTSKTQNLTDNKLATDTIYYPTTPSSSSSSSVKHPQTTSSTTTTTAAAAVTSIGPDSHVHRARTNARTSLVDNYNTDYCYAKYDNDFERASDLQCSVPINNSDTNTDAGADTGTRRLPWHRAGTGAAAGTEVGWTDRNGHI